MGGRQYKRTNLIATDLATSFVARVTRKPGRSQLLIFSRSYFHTIVSYTSRNEYSAGSMTSTVYPSYVRASLTILSTCVRSVRACVREYVRAQRLTSQQYRTHPQLSTCG